MNFRLIAICSVMTIFGAVLPVCAQLKPKTTSQVISVRVRELNGSSGGSATTVIRQALANSPYLQLLGQDDPDPASGYFSVIGTSSGGAISGEVIAPGKTTLLKDSYDSPELIDNGNQFADDIVATITGRAGIATSTICFVSDVSGIGQLYVCGYDGGNVRPVTSGDSPALSPALAPSGLALAYTSYQKGYPDIFYLNLLSGNQHQVAGAPGTCGGTAVSPDGTKVALSMSFTGNPEVFVVDVAGGQPSQITRTRGMESSPCWSPDGKWLAVAYDEGRGAKLRMLSIDGTTIRDLDTGAASATAPDWSADGVRIAFTMLTGGKTAVAIHDIQSSKTKVIADGDAHSPAWAPSGDQLVFSRGTSLCVYHFALAKETVIVDNLGQISEPDWSR